MKGLENDWIFLPDLARKEGRSSDDAAARVIHADGGPAALAVHAAVPRPGWTASGPVNAARVWLDAENEQHSRAEEVRVLYVALTRARERLVVLAGPSRGEAAWVKALGPWGYDAKNPPGDAELLCDGQVLHRIPAQAPRLRLVRPRPASEAMNCVERYETAVRSLRLASRSPFETPSGQREESTPVAPTRDSDSGASSRRDLGRSVGVVLHQALERWNAAGGDGLEPLLPGLCRDVALDNGVDLAALELAVGSVATSFLQSDLARRFREIEILGREVPMLLRRNSGEVYRGSIDLLYRSAAGEIVVVDYKTDAESDAAQLRDKYRGQLATYVEAVNHALSPDRPPRAELWLLRSGTRVAIR